jgi:hypothetical protein
MASETVPLNSITPLIPQSKGSRSMDASGKFIGPLLTTPADYVASLTRLQPADVSLRCGALPLATVYSVPYFENVLLLREQCQLGAAD